MVGFATIGDWTESKLANWLGQRLDQQQNIRNLVNRAVADATVPTGVIAATAASSAPDGWLLCDGASLVRADYQPLFDAIGTTYGSADASHFNVPDAMGRALYGVDAAALAANDGRALGSRGPTVAGTTGNDSGTGPFADSALGTHDRTAAVKPHTHTFSGNGGYLTVNHIIKI